MVLKGRGFEPRRAEPQDFWALATEVPVRKPSENVRVTLSG
jgi:hypothetical protein